MHFSDIHDILEPQKCTSVSPCVERRLVLGHATNAAEAAERLRARLGPGNAGRIPTARELAREFHIAERTALKALRQLRDEGLLEFSRGKRPRAAGTRSAHKDTAAGRLFEDLKQAIVKGAYRAGHIMPKLDYFVIGEHASRSTVSEAFRMLEREALAHKRGRQWVVGPGPDHRASPFDAAQPRGDRPVVVMLVPVQKVWEDLLNEHLRPFLSEFLAELGRRRLDFVLCQRENPLPHRSIFPTGRDETAALIRELGRRYAGTLIVTQPYRFPDLGDWIEQLAGFGRPVLWFDYDDSGPAMDRRAVGFDQFYRCFCNESRCVSLALESLSRFGHARVAVPVCETLARDEWYTHRVDLLREMSGHLEKPVDIITVDQDEPVWESIRTLEGHYVTSRRIDDLYVERRKSNVKLSDAAIGRLVRDALLEEFPSLASLPELDEITAVFAANQSLAVNYVIWFDAVGVRIPRDISLLAIDNYLRAAVFPVSTIAQNFEGLAYSMSHVFIGDIPVNADKRGNMPSEPEFVDRGSLGRPPRG
ncbi:MAG: GntR family transcriptional regulator [Chitinivibrionales bacterium]|nr:GntR family transcriptional regulator [Chitinivibrionales bacterium]MBD3396601.1 GntR family transcriptional regulator [Chitinivibrionales bacterium]